jgi:hypothetical protein
MEKTERAILKAAYTLEKFFQKDDWSQSCTKPCRALTDAVKADQKAKMKATMKEATKVLAK